MKTIPKTGSQISIIDSFYVNKLLQPYFSERALMSSRIYIEAVYLLALSQEEGIGIRKFTINEINLLKELHKITADDFEIIKAIETKGCTATINNRIVSFSKTDHDIKAIEYFIQLKLTGTSLEDCFNWIHFGLTSDDVNNLAIYRSIKLFLDEIYLTLLDENINVKKDKQLAELRKNIANLQLTAKLMGATGTLAAHNFTFPEINWLDFSRRFVESLGFKANIYVTQIEPKDCLAELFQMISLVNWLHIGRNKKADIYFHKANSLFHEFANKLPVSRLQRDLSDSTVQRNIGVAFGYTLLALKMLLGETMKKLSSEELLAAYDAISPLNGRYKKDVKELEQFSDLGSAVTITYIPAITAIINYLDKAANEYALIPMLARTHGQPATPTTVGKEYRVFTQRLQIQIEKLNNIKDSTAPAAISKLKTAEIIYTIARINTIIKNIAVDFWLYIMDEWIVQKNIGTTGSSTMPHKINPINFENAEGNVCVANALLYELISTDISVNNNEFDWKEAIGYSLLAAKSILKGLEKTSVNITKITAALQQHPEVIAEAYQTELRKPEYKIADPYNLIKQFTQGKQVTLQLLHEFIDSLTIPSAAKNKLKALTSEQYIGVAAVLASKQVKN